MILPDLRPGVPLIRRLELIKQRTPGIILTRQRLRVFRPYEGDDVGHRGVRGDHAVVGVRAEDGVAEVGEDVDLGAEPDGFARVGEGVAVGEGEVPPVPGGRWVRWDDGGGEWLTSCRGRLGWPSLSTVLCPFPRGHLRSLAGSARIPRRIPGNQASPRTFDQDTFEVVPARLYSAIRWTAISYPTLDQPQASTS